MKDEELSDEKLVEKSLAGAETAFELLVQRYYKRIISIIYQIIGNIQDAEDIAQEVFIKVYRNLNSFNRKAEFSTWLYRIAVNTTYNCLKKQKRHLPLDYIQRSDVLKKDSREELESKERQDLIRKAIERLPFKFRSTIVLKEIEGLSYKDIAKTLGCRIGTVESRLFRAREMLKKILFPILKKEEKDELC